MEGYSSEYKEASKKLGVNGIMILMKKTIGNAFITEVKEYWISVTFNCRYSSKRLRILGFYRPVTESKGRRKVWRKIKNVLKKENREVLVLGDWNEEQGRVMQMLNKNEDIGFTSMLEKGSRRTKGVDSRKVIDFPVWNYALTRKRTGKVTNDSGWKISDHKPSIVEIEEQVKERVLKRKLFLLVRGNLKK